MTVFSGIWPALVTPFTAENTIHTDTVTRLVAYLLEQGVDGFYVCGSTGGGVFLSVAERKQVLDAVLGTTAGQVPVLVHVGALALPDAIELARHAQGHGAAGFSSIIPPLYPSLDSILAYYKALAHAVPDFPLFPYIARPEIDALALIRELMPLPNVVGTKYTGPDMYEFHQITTLREDNWYVFAGMDEQSIFAAMAGSCGHIGSTLNFMPDVYITIRERLATGDHAGAMDLQHRANAIIQVLHGVDFRGGLNVLLDLMGFDCGHPRLPGMPLGDEEKRQFYADLEAVGFWELVERA